ncbi:MAG: acylphosphatase [Candidatus Dadabacteria bacterium]|nr:acylphosphatase [Candidatus Dadabacteria bacterium]NIS07308.1 acylphosphatase [Candidatus Dadabacteria bacterium]NIY20946.1 acylphosphatase [Candidatus Dadabacteria bacterium]
MPSIKRIHLIVHGIVQGVNFRFSTQQKALSLGLAGWVRNKKDGTVEAVAEGSEEELNEFIGWCNTGPKMAKVTKVDVTEVAASSKLADFTIEF